MKKLYLLFIITLLIFQRSPAQQSDPGEINLLTNTVQVQDLFKEIESQTDYRFVYGKNLDLKSVIKLENKKSVKVKEVLDIVSSRTGLRFRQTDNIIAVSSQPLISGDSDGLTKAVIQGKVIDKISGDPLIGATVSIKGTTQGNATDVNGNYAIVNVIPGNIVLVASYISYKSTEKSIVANDGQDIVVNFSLEEDQTTLAEVVVEAERITDNELPLLRDRKLSIVSQDAISLARIEQSGAINAVAGLQKVTGVSVKDGKYVSVRGMSDRNIVVEMNGARMSSANPERSSVPLDLFPAQLLDNITVEKTVTPDKPADATGGSVNVKTKSIPDSLFVSVLLQTGYNGNIGLGGDVLSFTNGETGVFGQGVERFKISDQLNQLRRDYSNDPSAVVTAINNGKNSPAQYQEAQRINSIMESFDPVLSTALRKSYGNQLFSVTGGNRFKLFGKTLGLFVGFTHSHKTEGFYNGQNNRYSVLEPGSTSQTPDIINPNQFRLLRRFTFREDYGVESISYGGLATLTYQVNSKNAVSLIYNGNRGVESTADRLVGSPNTSIQPVVTPQNAAGTTFGTISPRTSNINYSLRMTERPFQTWQVKGEHKVYPIKGDHIRLSWSASTSNSQQLDPDFRITRILIDSAGLNQVVASSGTSTISQQVFPIAYYPSSTRYFRELTEVNQNFRADVQVPFKFTPSVKGSFKVGVFYFSRERVYEESIINREEGLSNSGEILRLKEYGIDLSSLGGDVNQWAGSGSVGIVEGADNAGEPLVNGFVFDLQNSLNGYEATQSTQAIYGMVDSELNKNMRIAGGLRAENTRINALVDTLNAVIPESLDTQIQFDSAYVTDLANYKLLPSATFIYSLKDMKFRFSYSKTLARPEINEIINSSQFDPIQQVDFRGNNTLTLADYQNYDVRWDWFVSEDEIISSSVFYKRIENALERVFVQNDNIQIDEFGQLPATITYRNNPEIGYLYGVEFEFRKNLGKLFTPLKGFEAGVNLFFAYSETKFSDDEYYLRQQLNRDTEQKRSLFDQPNYVLNGNLIYNNDRWGTTLSAFLNYTGERLVEVNVDGTPNIYEKSAPELDFVFKQRLYKNLVLKGFVKNILNRETQYLYKNSIRLGDNGVGYLDETYVRRSFRQGTSVLVGVSYAF